jgi:hypothetical protein
LFDRGNPVDSEVRVIEGQHSPNEKRREERKPRNRRGENEADGRWNS